MLSDIPQDEAKYRRLLSKASLRLFRSKTWADPWFVDFVRYYRWWRIVKDRAAGGDRDYQVFLGYCFGLVERINSKVTEPMLAMGIPFGVFPTEFGDGQKAENFAQICRNWYAKPNVQAALRKSKKEMIITGTRWEVDEWLNIKRKGKMWGKVPKQVMTPIVDPKTGQPVMRGGKQVMMPSTVMVDAEVPVDVTTHYGFNTRYPSVFNMYPEPDRPTIGTGEKTDCSWLVEDMGELALEEMAKEFYVDPDTKMEVPVYDFEKMLHAYGRKAEERYAKIMQGKDAEDNYGPLITPEKDWNFTSDWGQIDKDSVAPTGATVDRASCEDRDKIRVVRHYQADEILTIANSRWIIGCKRDPYHVPGIKARVENYTTDPEFIYGLGAIRPVEDELRELNLTHEGCMDNFWRIIMKMVYVKEDAIISWDDFNARAGGKIRISNKYPSIQSAVMNADQMNVTQDMLAAESNQRGLIEFVDSMMDGSPGVAGTKQDHKTAKGMERIQFNTDTRFVTMAAQSFINEGNRGRNLQDFFNQFAFEKQPFRVVGDNGTTTYAKFDKSDIYTAGRPFSLVVEVDPLYGNNDAQRQNALAIFEQGKEYEILRQNAKDPSLRKVNLDILFENILKKGGYRDTSRIFTAPTGEMSPDDEYMVIAQGGVCECKGSLTDHITQHLLQLASPALKAGMEANKIHKDTAKNLNLLIQQDLAKLRTFMEDPQGAAAQTLNRLGMSLPGAPR